MPVSTILRRMWLDDDVNLSHLSFDCTDHHDDLREAQQRGTNVRLTSTCSAIRTSIKRVHGYANLFERHQTSICITCTIKADVRT